MSRKIVFFFVILVFSCLHGYSRSSNILSGAIGVGIIEEASVVLERTAITPTFFFRYTHKRNYFPVSLNYSIGLDFYLVNYYMVNYKLYYEAHNVSYEVPVHINFYLAVPEKRKIGFIIGTGMKLLMRFDEYSLGPEYFYSFSRLTPFPFITLGLKAKPVNRFRFTLYHHIGGGAGFFFFHSNDVFKHHQNYYFLHNQFLLDFAVKIGRRYFLIFNWTNTLDIYVNFGSFVPDGFFHNIFSMGFRYEF